MDSTMLAEIFNKLDLSEYDLDLTGYASDIRAEIMQCLVEKAIDFNEADKIIPEIKETYITKPGDIWNLGEHRLICGDSTKPETYAKLMQGEFARLIVTDPPYNVDYEGAAGKIMNDKMESSAFRVFLRDMYASAAAVTKDGAAAYIFHADAEGVAFREEFINAGFLLKQCLIWVKNSFVLGRQDYQWRHEPILYGWKGGAAHYFAADRNLSTVFDDVYRPDFDSMTREELAEMLEQIYDAAEELESSVLYFDKPLRNAEHPTMKPTALIAKLVENSSRAGWLVLDPFGGSGSTLIACEGTGRKARLIELDPRFCDVIVKRYMQVTCKRDVTLERGGKRINVAATGILD
ncbi:MAG: site-specific DNA-methyltransferase [Clostridiales bacterium]|nr:site-specific DNA-methyltransferase [Clostridiales bacterium]